MSIAFSSFLTRFKASETIAMARLARELKMQGRDVVDLSLGEPDFNTPEFIKKAGIDAINRNYSHYPPLAGHLELRRAVVKKLERDNNLFYQPENVLISTGAKQAIANLVLALVDVGDEVLIPAPYWNSYVDLVHMAQGVPVILPTCLEDGFKLKAEVLAKAITPKTKLLMFSSPSNPCGVQYSREELASWVKVLKEHPQIVIMSDEIYEYLYYQDKPESIAQFLEIQNRTVIINGLSKGYAMTGWRIGYMVAPIPVIEQCAKIQAQITSGANSMAQIASASALQQSPSFVNSMREEFRQRRDYMFERFRNMPYVRVIKPEGAFYLFPNFGAALGKQTANGEKIITSGDLLRYFLAEYAVVAVDGQAFGMPGFVRFSFANSLEFLQKACDRLEEALGALQ